MEKKFKYSLLILVISAILYYFIYFRPKVLGSIRGTFFETSDYPYIVTTNEKGDLKRVSANELLVPTGTIMLWASSTSPSGWLICDGSSIPSQYTELILLVGKNTPDLRDRVPVGAGGSLSLNSTGGSTTATLTTDNLPSHTHALDLRYDKTPDVGFEKVISDKTYVGLNMGISNLSNVESGSKEYTRYGKQTLYIPRTTNSTGSGSAFSIVPPYISLYYIIKV